MTPKQQMNIWVGDQIKLLDRLIMDLPNDSQNKAYISGVRSGIRILQDEWLKETFEQAPKETHEG